MIKVPFIEEELTKGRGIKSISKEGDGPGGGMSDVESCNRSPNLWSRGNPLRIHEILEIPVQVRGWGEVNARELLQYDGHASEIEIAEGVDGVVGWSTSFLGREMWLLREGSIQPCVQKKIVS